MSDEKKALDTDHQRANLFDALALRMGRYYKDLIFNDVPGPLAEKLVLNAQDNLLRMGDGIQGSEER